MTQPGIAVVGLGCIGGSLARALAAGDVHVRGWSTSRDDCEQARAASIEVAATLQAAIGDADLAVLAVPAQAMAEVGRAVCAAAAPGASIVHCCGVQTQAALRMNDATYARVIGAHPIAGSHESGFAASRADLFAGCTVSVETRTPASVREQMSWLWTRMGAACVEYLPADAQDARMTWISQLPQLAATALAETLASHHIDPRSVGSGARDSTRLAASAFDQWTSLVQAQPEALGAALEQLERTVASIRKALAAGDLRALEAIWESARAWRRGAEGRA